MGGADDQWQQAAARRFPAPNLLGRDCTARWRDGYGRRRLPVLALARELVDLARGFHEAGRGCSCR